VFHVVAATYTAKDFAQELLTYDCPPTIADEEVSVHVVYDQCKVCFIFMQGNTALHVAYAKGNKPVIDILLEASRKRGLKLEDVKNKVIWSCVSH
jgi:ankyrin repeat protein